MFNKALKTGLLATFVLAIAGTAQADVFNMPDEQKSLEFVTVGDPGNVTDLAHGHGAVDYIYRMGKYDVTAAQYCQFLNAVAATEDTYGLYNLRMANSPSLGPLDLGCGITRIDNSGSYTYSVLTGCDNYPVNYISWADAARFCNWLQNGQKNDPGTTEYGPYTLAGHTDVEYLRSVNRNPEAQYFIPSEDEWYKAAYYKGGGTNAEYWAYPTQSDDFPSNVLSSSENNNANFYSDIFGYTDPINYLTEVGAFSSSPGPYGTFDQGGILWQWTEAKAFTECRIVRGGNLMLGYDGFASFQYATAPLTDACFDSGFRVASVPEPGSITMLLMVALGALIWRRYKTA